MAIDATKGLPSFSEMYSAFKNRGNLGQALQSGMEGYMGAKAAASKENLQSAEATKNLAEAEYNRAHAKNIPNTQGLIRLDQITDPKEKADLSQYAQPNAEGLLVVPISTYNAVTHKQQTSEALDLKAQIAAAQAKSDAEKAALQNELLKVQQEKADLAAKNAPVNQTVAAASDLSRSAATVEPPTLLNRGLSAGKEMLGFQPTTAVAAERQGEAARNALQGVISHNAPTSLPPNPVDKATGIYTDPLETEAIKALNSQGKPVTPANIAEVKRRMGDMRGKSRSK